ncbi:hypothetical protein [Aquitalea pelogenes]|uniref:hypothetical protein n=1 Tax=Aquitalea pelogenes TaxID=1293573 RepID=UPI0007878DDC|nr:hypothetical protein [Aquitalea pelogenes]
MDQQTVKKLTAEQKEKLIEDLSFPWGKADLMCDGRRITLEVRRVAKGISYRVCTFVDGVFEYKWAQGSSEYPEQKFLRKSVRPLVSPVKRKEFEKKFGKRAVQKDKYINGSVTLYLPDWSSGKAAINHLCKVCDSVEIAEKTEAKTAFVKE